MYNIEKTVNNYNNYLMDLLWNNKAKFFSFIAVTVIAFVNIPNLNNLQDNISLLSTWKEKLPKFVFLDH